MGKKTEKGRRGTVNGDLWTVKERKIRQSAKSKTTMLLTRQPAKGLFVRTSILIQS